MIRLTIRFFSLGADREWDNPLDTIVEWYSDFKEALRIKRGYELDGCLVEMDYEHDTLSA